MRFLHVLALGAGFFAAMPAALAGEPLDPHDAVLRMTTQKLATAMLEDAVLAIGRLVRETQLPVPNRPLPPGRAIAASDLQWVAAGDRPLAGNVARDPSEMIGRLPRRALPQGAPVITADLKRPLAVARGTLVTILLGTPSMRLTARGQALDAGAVGDTIRVANAQSRTVVGGVVRADGQVEVIAGGQPAAR